MQVTAKEPVDMSAFARAPETAEEKAKRQAYAAAAQKAADAADAKAGNLQSCTIECRMRDQDRLLSSG